MPHAARAGGSASAERASGAVPPAGRPSLPAPPGGLKRRYGRSSSSRPCSCDRAACPGRRYSRARIPPETCLRGGGTPAPPDRPKGGVGTDESGDSRSAPLPSRRHRPGTDWQRPPVRVRRGPDRGPRPSSLHSPRRHGQVGSQPRPRPTGRGPRPPVRWRRLQGDEVPRGRLTPGRGRATPALSGSVPEGSDFAVS